MPTSLHCLTRRNDARDIAGALRDLGFKVIEGHNLDSTAMRGKIEEFGAALPGAGVSLLYYAGHGMQAAGKNYLIPVDAKLERPSSLGVEAIEVNTVISDMEAEKRINLVFLDACPDAGMVQEIQRPGLTGAIPPRARGVLRASCWENRRTAYPKRSLLRCGLDVCSISHSIHTKAVPRPTTTPRNNSVRPGIVSIVSMVSIHDLNAAKQCKQRTSRWPREMACAQNTPRPLDSSRP